MKWERSDLTRVSHDEQAVVDPAGHGVGGSMERREAAALREQARVQRLPCSLSGQVVIGDCKAEVSLTC